MKLTQKGLTLATLSCALLAFGCGVGPQQIEAPSQQDVNKVADLRKIFDRVHGDYSQTTDAEKKQFLDYEKGKQSEVDHLWSFMKNPRGGGLTEQPNRPFATGPGGQILPPNSGG